MFAPSRAHRTRTLYQSKMLVALTLRHGTPACHSLNRGSAAAKCGIFLSRLHLLDAAGPRT
jgi:hypothetical protein